MFRGESLRDLKKNVYMYRYEPDLVRAKKIVNIKPDPYDAYAPNVNGYWMRKSESTPLGKEKLQFNYRSTDERLKSAENRQRVINNEPLNSNMYKFPCFRHTSKDKWVKTKDF